MSKQTNPTDLQAIAGRWRLEAAALTDLEALRQALAVRISEWLDNDFSRLLNVMYRLDVSEAQFNAVLTSGNPKTVPLQLADLVLKREFQRIETRKKYSA